MNKYKTITLELVSLYNVNGKFLIDNLKDLFDYLNKKAIDDYKVEITESIYSAPELLIRINGNISNNQFRLKCRTVNYINDGSDRYINTNMCIQNLLCEFDKNKRSCKIANLICLK